MSRIGRKPINIPAGVEVKIDANVVTVKGPKATLTQSIHPNMTIALDGGAVTVSRPNDEKKNRSLHGLSRTLVANMVEGVTNGFKKELDVNGVGYRVVMKGSDTIDMTLGYSHHVFMTAPDGIKLECPTPNKIVVSGADKQQVGQFAAQIREKRPPEPYKGKGIKYSNEVIRRKEGKAGKGGKK